MAESHRFDLSAKFRGMSRALRGSYDAARVGGRHAGEKGMRREHTLHEFLRRHLPPRYGVARGEIVSARGEVSRQVDVVIYDALFSPLLQSADASGVFAAESVYAAIEVKASLNTTDLAEAVYNIKSVKALSRSATVREHGGHRRLHAARANPPIFGAVFAPKGSNIPKRVFPGLEEHNRQLPRELWIDCVCILDKALLYHFVRGGQPPGFLHWIPSVLSEESYLGYIEAKKDTLMIFFLFLLHQINSKDLFPPDLLQYAQGLPVPAPVVPGHEL